jgi:hypothetical protein
MHVVKDGDFDYLVGLARVPGIDFDVVEACFAAV